MVLKFKTTILETGETIEAGMDETITFIEAHVAGVDDAGLDHLADLMAEGESYGSMLKYAPTLMSAIDEAGKRVGVSVDCDYD